MEERGRDLQTFRLWCSAGPASIHHTSSSSPPDLKNKVLKVLSRYFYDIEIFQYWGLHWKQWRLNAKNERIYAVESLCGVNVAATYYALSQNGGVRYSGREEWIRANQRGWNKREIMKFKDVPVECVDLSNSEVNYIGLGNIMELHQLRYLNLSRCAYIDDWCLSRLQVFGPSLEVLILAGCPQVSERGLASLHHLQNLKYLDISDLPNVENKGLTRILLEEVLPACEIAGMEYLDELKESSVQTEV
ncbi:distal membrane-arm assembly complex protein 2-like isoform X5 [Hyperolius riggenbachi]|uniref:distal membrane-arm assembly complex protein 2-like isoform X5 n=1 Tax=Hyperolius riggenbachi TaxID=752182 RepID=UPI0035A38243